MSSLNARAQAIRNAATSALDEQHTNEILRRAVSLATKLHSVSEHVVRSQAVVRSLVDLSVPPPKLPSNRHVLGLVKKAEPRVSALTEFMQSGLPGELELAVGDYAGNLETAAKDAWQQYATTQAASVGAASVLEKALGSIPRFRQTIINTRRSRLEINRLKAVAMPTADAVRDFKQHLDVLEASGKELEREVPREFRDTLRRCATPEGVSPNDLPDGFLDWIETVGARSYFKVTLSDL